MIDRLHDWAWNRWYKKAQAKAMLNERYAEIRKLTYDASTGLHRYKADLFNEEHILFRQMNPHPWWHKLWHRYLPVRAAVRDWRRPFQRARYGISDSDVWNLDGYLNTVLVRGLTELRDSSFGYPGNLNSMGEWQAILDKMIAGFSDPESDDHAEAVSLLAEYYTSLWN